MCGDESSNREMEEVYLSRSVARGLIVYLRATHFVDTHSVAYHVEHIFRSLRGFLL